MSQPLEFRSLGLAKMAALLVAFAFLHFGAVNLGLALYFDPTSVATLWPGSGLLMGALIVCHKRYWPVIVASATIAQISADTLVFDQSLAIASLYGLNNTLEVLVGAYLMLKLCGGVPELGKLRHVIGLFVVGAIVSTLFSTAGGSAIAASVSGADFWSIFQVWWFADVLGVLITVPVVLAFAKSISSESRRVGRTLELILLFVGLIVVCQVVFGGSAAEVRFIFDQPFVVFPFIIWAALRFDERALSVALFFAALMIVVNADAGNGPFIRATSSVNELVLSIQGFVALLSLMGLVLHAVIAERMSAEEALKESDETAQTLLNATHESALLVTPFDGEILALNETAARDLGTTMNDAIGLRLRDLVPLDVAESRLEKSAEVVRTGKPVHFQDERDGMHFDITLYPIFDTLGEVVQLAVFAQNISESKSAAAAILEKEEQLNDLLSNVGAIILEGTHHELTYVGGQVERILGYPLKEWYEHPDGPLGFWSSKLHQGDMHNFEECARAISQGNDHSFEYRMIAADGREVWFWDTITVDTSGGKPYKTRAVMVDISERKRADEELRQSEEKYRGFVETSQDLVWRCDHEGVFTYLNPAWEGSVGYTADEMIGHHFTEFKPSEAAERDEQQFQNVLDEKSTFGYETVYISKSGDPRILVFNALVVRDADGNAIGTQGTAHDITERKRAEDALRISATRLQIATEATRIGHWDWNLRNNEIYFSPEWKRQLGYDDDELENRFETWEALLHPDDLQGTVNAVEDYIAGRRDDYEVEFRLKHKDGTYRWIYTRAEKQFDDSGEPARIFGCHVDITDRKIAEEERVRLMSAIEQSAESVMITDVKGTIQYVNSGFEQVTGYSRDEAIGKNPRMLKSGTQDDGFYQEMWVTLVRGDSWSGQIVNKKKDGSLYTEEMLISPVSDAQGKTVNYVAVRRDITKEIELEEQLHQAQKMESIGRLAGGVAHDLNNLLTPIIGYSEMMQQDLDPTEPQWESIQAIRHAGRAAQELVRQLLAFSRKQTLEIKAVDINKTVTDFEALLRRTTREDIEIEIALSPDVSTVMADVGQIEQVIMNLAVNAADAMPDGGRMTIETASVELDESYAARRPGVTPGEYVMLSVSDTGTGMDDETREHLFEPFYSTKGEQGTGLGLSTVYGIVAQHGGNIMVSSEAGVGTTFKVYLPVSDSEYVEEEVRKAPTTELTGTETVLLVEDYEPLRKLAETILERQGYTVLRAESGFEALSVLDSYDGPLHLLLTDVVMPKMSGKQLFDRAVEKQPSLKVLFMSGYSEDEISHHGVLHERTAFIRKPFTIDGLAAKVREVLDTELEV